MRLNSLALRLFAASALWTLLVMPVAWYMLDRSLRERERRNLDAHAELLVSQIAVDSMDTTGSEPVPPPNRFEPRFELPNSGWYWQVKPIDPSPARTLVSPSLATATLDSLFLKNLPANESGQRWADLPGPSGRMLRFVEVVDTIGHSGSGTRYSVTVTYPLDWITSRVNEVVPALLMGLALTGLGLVAMTWFQVRFGLLPLKQIEKGLSAIRNGEATSLAGELPVEIEPLQQELNALIQSNQDIVDRARTQVGNLAHALKTPLAVITNEAREDKSPFGAKVAEQASLMRDQINHYLDRARVAARIGVGRSTEIRTVVEPLVRALERINRERDIRISFECPPDVKFQGEKHDLEEMLGNLLDNACKWAKRNVMLTVSGPARDARGPSRRLTILVEDDGKGLTDDQRKRIGKRGLRLDESKPGSGLGLSIVTDLVQSYRGAFSLDKSPRGGLLVRLELPAV